MPFTYFEITRSELAKLTPEVPILKGLTKGQRAEFKANLNQAFGRSVKAQLDVLGALDWELVGIVQSESHGGELLYTFKKS